MDRLSLPFVVFEVWPGSDGEQYPVVVQRARQDVHVHAEGAPHVDVVCHACNIQD